MDLLTALTIFIPLLTAIACFGLSKDSPMRALLAMDVLILTLSVTAVALVILETQH